MITVSWQLNKIFSPSPTGELEETTALNYFDSERKKKSKNDVLVAQVQSMQEVGDGQRLGSALWTRLLPRAYLFSTSSEPTTRRAWLSLNSTMKSFPPQLEGLVAELYIKGVTQKCNVVYVYTRCEVTGPCSQTPNSSNQQHKIVSLGEAASPPRYRLPLWLRGSVRP